MSTFQLDTSGRVECPASFQPLGWAIWSDLTPFAQGYVEAMFDTPVGPAELWVGKTFSDLAPATLARIIGDCANRVANLPAGIATTDNTREAGRHFWERQQAGRLAVFGYPPLTPYLGDDGLIYLREGS